MKIITNWHETLPELRSHALAWRDAAIQAGWADADEVLQRWLTRIPALHLGTCVHCRVPAASFDLLFASPARCPQCATQFDSVERFDPPAPCPNCQALIKVDDPNAPNPRRLFPHGPEAPTIPTYGLCGVCEASEPGHAAFHRDFDEAAERERLRRLPAEHCGNDEQVLQKHACCPWAARGVPCEIAKRAHKPVGKTDMLSFVSPLLAVLVLAYLLLIHATWGGVLTPAPSVPNPDDPTPRQSSSTLFPRVIPPFREGEFPAQGEGREPPWGTGIGRKLSPPLKDWPEFGPRWVDIDRNAPRLR